MSGNSVSAVPVILEIKEKFQIKCELKRHLSPKTVGMINRSIPLKGNVHKFGTFGIYFEVQITSGVERPKKEFKRGDIAFYPVGNCISFFYENSVHGKPMTPIGKIITDIDELIQANVGDEILFYGDTG